MATNMYIKFEEPEIKGGCSAKNHNDEIEVLSWSHSFSQPTSPVRTSAGAGTVERANHSDLSFTKYLDSATDDLLQNCWSGKHIKKATLQCYRADGDKANEPVLYLSVEMDEVVISNISLSGGAGDIPIENVSLNYGKVTYTYKSQKKDDGSAGDNQPVSHDLTTNEVGTS